MPLEAMRPWIKLHELDNVAIVVADDGVRAGAALDGPGAPTVRGDVARGHKVALRRIPKGAPVLKFGHVIGVATRDVEAGEHVHTHNIGMPGGADGPLDGVAALSSAAGRGRGLPDTFQGYARTSGPAGVRNYVVVVSSVNCSATVVKAICNRFLNRADLVARGVHGVVPVTHTEGCAQAIGGLEYKVLNRTLAGWISHPNVVGAVVIGLGCEGTTIRTILEQRAALGHTRPIPIEHLGIQDVGGTAKAINGGTALVEKVLAALPKLERTELPVSHLALALKCGGSDAFSAITANPALGLVSDILVAKGGMTAFAEIPECHGAEDLLGRRCRTDEDRRKLRRIFEWWETYTKRHDVTLNNNLAPGNIAGGITTIIEKSLGAVAKGGSEAVSQVVDFAEPITRKGLAIMNTPGFDPVSVTGLVAGGCTLVAFTTGRGSVYGCSIAPTMKIATTTDLFRRMEGDMDIDAGEALREGGVEGVADRLYRFTVEVASGRPTCSEELGLGREEFAPWPVGETL